MKVMISGYYGFHNIGDEAILKSIIIALREENPDIKITVLSNDVEYTKETYGVDAINRWGLANIYKELLKCDGLISGGGSLLQDVTSSRSILYYNAIIGLASMAKRPVFIYAQGIGPINKKINKKITKYFLNKSRYITLRDSESACFVKSIGVDKIINIVPDPVMGFEFSNANSSSNNKYKNKNYVTISIREWNHAKFDFKKKLAKACDELVENGVDVIFIPMHGDKDEKISKSIMNDMKLKAEVLPWDTSMEEKANCIKHSKLMIGMRLHALIFAAIVYTPMLGISYDPKIDSYLKLVNQPCIGSMEYEWESKDLANKSLSIIKNYDTEKSKLYDSTLKQRQLAKKTAKIALNEFRS